MKRAIFSVCCIMLSLLMILNTFRKVSGIEGEATLEGTLNIIAEYDWGFSKTYEQIARTGKAWEDLGGIKDGTVLDHDVIQTTSIFGKIWRDIINTLFHGDGNTSITNNSLGEFLRALIESIKVPFVAIGELLKECYNVVNVTYKLLGKNFNEETTTPTPDPGEEGGDGGGFGGGGGRPW